MVRQLKISFIFIFNRLIKGIFGLGILLVLAKRSPNKNDLIFAFISPLYLFGDVFEGERWCWILV